MHFGSLLAALAGFLEARRHGGEWLVRIEDVDTPRVVAGASDAILRSLECHHRVRDGTVDHQSHRIERYEWALERLQTTGLIYPCTCSRRELAELVPLGPHGRIYPGLCRQAPRRTDRPAALRLRVPDEVIGFRDRLQGDYRQHLASEVGDFVLRRADGLFAYQLAVVVDDAEQGITDVVRGSDLLDSTPRQRYLQILLGATAPGYLHIPVAVDARGAKLSKQTGAPALDDGRPAASLLAALEFLGQQPPGELNRADAVTVMAWARESWNPSRIPARLTIPWPRAIR